MSIVLDTAIGLTLVFLLVSLFASALQEAISNTVNSRGKLLESAIAQLLDGNLVKPNGFTSRVTRAFSGAARVHTGNAEWHDSLAAQVMGHGLIQGLLKGDRLPSYIPADKFADALIDCLRRMTAAKTPTTRSLLEAVRKLIPTPGTRALETLLVASGSDVAEFRTQLIGWYETSMDRVSGWYTRAVRGRTFALGLVIAMAFEINAIRITQELMQNSALRAELVTAAQAQTRAGLQANEEITAAMNRLTSLGLPIGWSSCSYRADSNSDGQCANELFDFQKAAFMLLGWLLVALAVTQGAPFWFDLINRLVAARGAGPKPAVEAGAGADKAGSGASAATGPSRSLWTGQSPEESTVPPGMTEDDLRNLQTVLRVPVTAAIDVDTREAVRQFQLNVGIAVPRALDAALAREILQSK